MCNKNIEFEYWTVQSNFPTDLKKRDQDRGGGAVIWSCKFTLRDTYLFWNILYKA